MHIYMVCMVNPKTYQTYTVGLVKPPYIIYYDMENI